MHWLTNRLSTCAEPLTSGDPSVVSNGVCRSSTSKSRRLPCGGRRWPGPFSESAWRTRRLRPPIAAAVLLDNGTPRTMHLDTRTSGTHMLTSLYVFVCVCVCVCVCAPRTCDKINQEYTNITSIVTGQRTLSQTNRRCVADKGYTSSSG